MLFTFLNHIFETYFVTQLPTYTIKLFENQWFHPRIIPVEFGQKPVRGFRREDI